MADHADYPEITMLINGEWISGEGRDTKPVVNPATDETVGRIPQVTEVELARVIDATSRAFREWREVSPHDRSAILRRAADLIRERSDRIGEIMTLEQGKPLVQSREEVMFSADYFDWSAEEGRRAYGRIIPGRRPDAHFAVLRQPIGLVAAFTPWNFPAASPSRKLAAALGTGCSIIVKPAAYTPGTCMELVRALVDAGVPSGAVQMVTGSAGLISDRLIGSDVIRKVTFTGSTTVGRQVAEACAKAPKKATLELGGHAPVLVFDDADVEAAAVASVTTKFRNAGQICISPTRFFIHENIYPQFQEAFVEGMRKLKVGNGLEDGTRMGPLVHQSRVAEVSELMEDARAHGAEIIQGLQNFDAAGAYHQPTVIAHAPDTARAMYEEPFGPLALMGSFKTDDEALALANKLPYGLASYLFTSDLNRAQRAVREIEAGMVGVNGFAVTVAETPFGGMKDSGYGIEGGAEGHEGYLETKLVSYQ